MSFFERFDMGKDKDTRREDFLFELQRKIVEIENLVDEYDLRDQYVSINISGLVDTENMDEDTSELKAFFTFAVKDEVELEVLIDFIRKSYQDQSEGPDLDFLDDLGISLN